MFLYDFPVNEAVWLNCTSKVAIYWQANNDFHKVLTGKCLNTQCVALHLVQEGRRDHSLTAGYHLTEILLNLQEHARG
jgi:hypothetical protein